MRYMRKVLAFCAAIALTVCASHISSKWRDFSKIKHDKPVTMDPWVRKHWNHVKILTDTLNYMQSTKTILFWTKFFGESNYVPSYSKLYCPKLPKCFVTFDRNYLNRSDAVVFHLRDINVNDMPALRVPQQVWILLHHEAPPHTPSDILDQVSGLFNWTATYRLDSEFILSPIVRKKKQDTKEKKPLVQNKKKMIAWLVSNCKTPSNREEYVSELQKTVPVDIFGTCGKYTCLPKMSDECYNKLGQKYHFYLSFENSICKDYVTEKFFHILGTDMIPVVLGGANYSQIAPPNSYIDALAFKTPRDLGQYLLQVAKDEKKYQSYFEWKESYELAYEHYVCQICVKLNQPDLSHSTYLNVSQWWYESASCKTWLNSPKKFKEYLNRKAFINL